MREGGRERWRGREEEGGRDKEEEKERGLKHTYSMGHGKVYVFLPFRSV